jgi:hypothetical protein
MGLLLKRGLLCIMIVADVEMVEVDKQSVQVLLLEALAFGGFLWEEETALRSQLDMRDHADGQRGEERNCEQ